MLIDPRRPPRCWPALGSAQYKCQPCDFKVAEQLSFVPSGRGEHLFFHIQKWQMNSHEVAVELAELCNVPRKAVSFAGRKDKHALTEQWFSVHRPGIERPRLPEQSHWRVLQVTRHAKRLPRGAVASNRFEVVLRNVDVELDTLRKRWELAIQGVPNYFGPQRFGLRNLERAQQGDQEEMVVAAARAAVFNRMLGERVQSGHWLALTPGEPCLRRASNGWLTDATDQQVAQGLADPCLPLYGPTPGIAADRQDAWRSEFDHHSQDLESCLASQSFQPFRRRVRVVPRSPSLAVDENGISIGATLGAGAFMTALLDFMFDLKDAHASNFDQ